MPGPMMSINLAGSPADRFYLTGFSGKETLGRVSSYHLDIVTEESGLKADDFIGKKVSVELKSKSGEDSFHGVVVSYTQLGLQSELFAYRLVMQPGLSLLSYHTRNRVFLQSSVQDIIKQVLTDAGIDSARFKFQLSGGPLREFTVQYNESDLAFLQRLMEHEGIFYFHPPGAGDDDFVICDSNSALKSAPGSQTVHFHPDTGLEIDEAYISSLMRHGNLSVGSVLLKDYFDQTPDTDVAAKKSGNGEGEFYHYHDHVHNNNEAARMAEIRLEELNCLKDLLKGESDAFPMRAGMRIDIADDTGNGFEGTYIITEVEHRAEQGSMATGAKYSNKFHCIPSDTPFRSQRITPDPKINGVINAKVDGQSGNYAFIDEQGRYRIKLPFDLSDRKNGQASSTVRMAQPHSGPNYGMHFPLHVGTEVLLAFENGDVDRPVIVGTVPNPSNASPVKNSNRFLNKIRTSTGHEIILDDTDKETAIIIKTSGNHMISLLDKKDEKGIIIKTDGKHQFHMDDKGERIKVQTTKGHIFELDDGGKKASIRTTSGHSFEMDDEGKSISIKDGGGKTSIEMDQKGGKISMTASKDIELTAGKNINMSAGNEIEMSAKKEIDLESDKIEVQAKSQITEKSGKKISVSAKDSLTVSAKKISQTAKSQMQLKARKILEEGKNTLLLKGKKAILRAKSDVVIKGSKIKQN